MTQRLRKVFLSEEITTVASYSRDRYKLCFCSLVHSTWLNCEMNHKATQTKSLAHEPTQFVLVQDAFKD